MDARQRLLDALAEVERLDKEVENLRSRGEQELGFFWQWDTAVRARNAALHALLPTLAALREVVEMHGWDVDALRDGEVCRHCDHDWPCPTLSTLTRQFEED